MLREIPRRASSSPRISPRCLEGDARRRRGRHLITGWHLTDACRIWPRGAQTYRPGPSHRRPAEASCRLAPEIFPAQPGCWSPANFLRRAPEIGRTLAAAGRLLRIIPSNPCFDLHPSGDASAGGAAGLAALAPPAISLLKTPINNMILTQIKYISLQTWTNRPDVSFKYADTLAVSSRIWIHERLAVRDSSFR